MRNVLIFYLSVFTATALFAQPDSAKIDFILFAKNLSNEDAVFITGNNSLLANWYPNMVKMERMNDSTFVKSLYFPVDTFLEFKFTKGSWDTEELNEDGSVRGNHNLLVANDSIFTHSIRYWKHESGRSHEGQITGNVEYIYDIKSHNELLPRDIIIWLPPEYYKNTNQSYPVLYMHDGQNIIDPQTSFLGIDWQIDETTDSLIRTNQIEPLIIVGIYNTYNRKVEYSENDTGYAYIDFIVNTLKPKVDKKYRTKPDNKNTAIAGSSMGGLISFMAAWERPDVFSKAACLSPAFKIRTYDYVDNVLNYEGEKKELLFYIDNGGVGLEDSLQSGINEMLSTLKSKGYQENVDFVWVKDELAEHNESAWAKRTRNFLKLFYENESK